MFYTYLYIDPRNDEPFYVGKGSGRRAWASHSKQVNGYIRNLKKVGASHIVENIQVKIREFGDKCVLSK